MKLIHLLKEMLNEIGETTYDISEPKIVSSTPKKNIVKYFFTSGEGVDGVDYEVVFESNFISTGEKYKWETDITFDKVGAGDEELYSFFGSDDAYSETGKGDAIAVLFTVAKAVKDFINKFKPEFLTYTGSLSAKELSALSDPDRKADAVKMTTVRDRIYDKMVNNMISDFPDYDFKRSGFNMDIFYKGELPVPGHHKIFDYPKA